MTTLVDRTHIGVVETATRPALLRADPVILAGARVGDNCKIGPGSVIGERAFLERGVIIGRGVRVGKGAVIEAGTSVRDGALIGEKARIGPRTLIKDGAHINEGARIGPEVIVGEKAEVLAYNVVPKDTVVKSNSVFGELPWETDLRV